MGAQMFVSLMVWNRNPNPCTNRDEILQAHPHTSKKRGSETLKAEGHIIENCQHNKRCSSGCKLTRAAPGTSACYIKKESNCLLMQWERQYNFIQESIDLIKSDMLLAWKLASLIKK